jgi:hypothetical protein
VFLLQDYEDACSWTPADYAELQMQRHDPEAGMHPTHLTRGPASPTASWPGRTYDLDDHWEAWRSRAAAVQAAHGWTHETNKTKTDTEEEATTKASLLARWGVPEGFFQDRRRWAWADHVIKSREWEDHQLCVHLNAYSHVTTPRMVVW